MQFRIADSFSKALGKLTAREQSAVKVTVFDLQQDPAAPGLKFHRIDKSKDRSFWSIRANRDIRIVVHKTADSFLVCYVDHHDDAYKWAERRRIDTHPKTGAAQIVEVRELVEEITVHRPARVEPGPESRATYPGGVSSRPFAGLSEDELLTAGVPMDWLADIQSATEDGFLDLADHLPEEASEALLEYAATGSLVVFKTDVPSGDPFEHPDALRRFRVLDNIEELKRALDYPWDQWTIFLHPAQRHAVDQKFDGAARVSGSAGTGKTVVALHRTAAVLQSQKNAKVLLTTFSAPLANALDHKLGLLIGKSSPVLSNVTVRSFEGVAYDLFTLAFGHTPHVASAEKVRGSIQSAIIELGDPGFTLRFMMSEWKNVVDAWQIRGLEGYRDVPRLGRKGRLGSKQRERLWPVFARARELLKAQGVSTWPGVFGEVSEYYKQREHKPFTHIIVDEAQDLGVPELRMLAAVAGAETDALFFAGDLGQRIFQEPFSWKALGIDVRGRSRTLKVNYRTSHQIRQTVDGLLPSTVRDVDGNEDDRRGTVSVFNGPLPKIVLAQDSDQEIEEIAQWVSDTLDAGVKPEDVGLFVRSNNELSRARAVVKTVGLKALELSERIEDRKGRVSIGTMHLAKGLEFRAVAVMACDEDILPLQGRIESVADESELDEVFETERHLFYVACTRARDHLVVSGVKPASEFISDLSREH